MGVNYYAATPETPEGEERKGLHIGKHSGGLEFLFHAHSDLGLITVAAWREYLSKPGVRIVAEHGLEEPLDEFMADATKRPADALPGERRIRSRSEGVSFRDTDGRGVAFADYDFF